MSRSYAQRFPVPPWRYRFGEAGGMSRLGDFNPRSCGGRGALGAHFASFFRLRFLYRFFIDFFLILEGFGSPKWVPKSVFGAIFGRHFRILILGCFLMTILVVFLTLESLKIVLPSRRELNFHKIAFFTHDGKKQ